MILIYPGSFDPVTLGHMDIAERGARLATRLIVAVLDNPNKKPLFCSEERVALLQESLGHVKNIEIDRFSGLLAEYATQKNAAAILRGLRSPGDFETEARYAAYNKLLSNAGLETVFIPASPPLSYISSSIVREAAFHISNNSALCNMVTPHVQAALETRIRLGE